MCCGMATSAFEFLATHAGVSQFAGVSGVLAGDSGQLAGVVHK